MPNHDVYWASHGCKKQWPHEGACRCSCGEYLQRYHTVYGYNAATAKTWLDRQIEKAPSERLHA